MDEAAGVPIESARPADADSDTGTGGRRLAAAGVSAGGGATVCDKVRTASGPGAAAPGCGAAAGPSMTPSRSPVVVTGRDEGSSGGRFEADTSAADVVGADASPGGSSPSAGSPRD